MAVSPTKNLAGSHCLAQIGTAKNIPTRASPPAMPTGAITKTRRLCPISPKMQHPGTAACRETISSPPAWIYSSGLSLNLFFMIFSSLFFQEFVRFASQQLPSPPGEGTPGPRPIQSIGRMHPRGPPDRRAVGKGPLAARGAVTARLCL